MVREINFRIDAPLKSKARPRFGKGRSYMPKEYMDWKELVREQLKQIWAEQELETLEQFELHVEGHGPGRNDGDNLIAAFMDCGLPCKKTGWPGAWRDDRVTVIPYLSFRWIRDKEQFWDVSIRVLSANLNL